ncbi:hypothetical protein EVAR_51003_1 [Eumeta japonica]|uniref:Uncharacterized protein n=1 Tax=Eumeta variegata TaxID=151549 RepID=A0A4C1ZVW5_EUMVA|nr:hypothetical protein EVAR_51003_1 [Eumeta japonica]
MAFSPPDRNISRSRLKRSVAPPTDSKRNTIKCCARRPIIVEWERRKAFGGPLSRSVTHRYVTERYTFQMERHLRITGRHRREWGRRARIPRRSACRRSRSASSLGSAREHSLIRARGRGFLLFVTFEESGRKTWGGFLLCQISEPIEGVKGYQRHAISRRVAVKK